MAQNLFVEYPEPRGEANNLHKCTQMKKSLGQCGIVSVHFTSMTIVAHLGLFC